MIIEAEAKGCCLSVRQPDITSGSAGIVSVRFVTDEAWDGFLITAVFRTRGRDYLCVPSGNICTFPPEALENCGDVLMGLFGVRGEDIITSSLARVHISQGTPKNGEEAENYTPSLYEQFAEKFAKFENMTATAETADEAAVSVSEISGAFRLDFSLPKGDKGDTGEAGADGANGTDGIDGTDGADGYTPVRGVDYWTDADIATIKGYVDEAILGGAW